MIMRRIVIIALLMTLAIGCSHKITYDDFDWVITTDTGFRLYRDSSHFYINNNEVCYELNIKDTLFKTCIFINCKKEIPIKFKESGIEEDERSYRVYANPFDDLDSVIVESNSSRMRLFTEKYTLFIFRNEDECKYPFMDKDFRVIENCGFIDSNRLLVLFRIGSLLDTDFGIGLLDLNKLINGKEDGDTVKICNFEERIVDNETIP
jgi:hypothetical protein